MESQLCRQITHQPIFSTFILPLLGVINVIFFQLSYAGRLPLICVYVNPDYNYAL